MDSATARRLVDALAGWSRDVGWRIDGWAALAAIGLLWRPPDTILYAEGPSRPGSTQLDAAHQRLHRITGIHIGPCRPQAGSPTRGTVELADHRGRCSQQLILAPSARPRPAVQIDPPHLLRTPPLDQLLARRIRLLATPAVDARRRHNATVDACALATILPDRDRHRLTARLAPPTLASAVAVVSRLEPDVLQAVDSDHHDEVVDGLARLSQLRSSP